MLPTAVHEALQALAAYAASSPDALAALVRWWRAADADATPPFSDEVRRAADVVDAALPGATRSTAGTEALRRLLGNEPGAVILAWCEGASARGDVRLAPLVAAAAANPSLRDRAASVARARIVGGPLLDALSCAPSSGGGAWLTEPTSSQARARLEILLWEAGAVALQLPELGAWVWGSRETCDALILKPARGALRGRVLAARCLEVAGAGMPANTDPELVGATMRTLQPLLLHPEPLVWVHASRAVGRLAGVLDALEGTLLDWVQGESALLRQRAVTAFASLSRDKLRMLAGELGRLLDDPAQEPWVLAAAGAATPYLLTERKDLWDRLSARILAGDGGPVAARGLARGLGALWRRGVHTTAVEVPLRALREMARRARTDSVNNWRRWIDVLSETDALDGAERDPLDVERGLENLVRLAAQYDDEEADARALHFASSLTSTFEEARRIALSEPRARRRAAGLNAIEGVGRSLALRLWGPLLHTRPEGTPLSEPDLDETWGALVNAPQEILDEVVALRSAGTLDDETAAVLEILALRLGGYALDACSEEPSLGPGRGPTAHRTCLWLRKFAGLRRVGGPLQPELRAALSALCWRLVDTTRGASLGESNDDVRWLGPFAAWWALVIDEPSTLAQVAVALPMLTQGVLEHCVKQSDLMRSALDPAAPRAAEGAWASTVQGVLRELKAQETELARALRDMADALARFAHMAGPKADLEERCTDLALASERLVTALENPVLALRENDDDVFLSEGAPRVGAQVAGAIRARDLGPLSVWFDSLGPLTRELVRQAVAAAVRRTPPPPPMRKSVRPGPEMIEGYELVRPLGEGGIGSVWLARKPGKERYFVLKIPRADALLGASETEHEAILASFTEEARALASLYHPNIASIIDRGVHKGLPFLVLEYLIGADLRTYSAARTMNVYELRTVVPEACAGLGALHAAGLVHRDVKPANIWVRLGLNGGETFDPAKHRDPAKVPVLATVVIDMGMVRAFRVAQEAMGRFVAGTPGYLAPEQVLDPIDLDGRADVYAMAGTVYNVMTGRSFFDDITSARERIFAHIHREPLEDPERVRGFPPGLVKLLRAATARNPKERPDIGAFAREFVALV